MHTLRKIIIGIVLIITITTLMACNRNYEFQDLDYGYFNEKHVDSSVTFDAVDNALAMDSDQGAAALYLLNLSLDNMLKLNFAARVSTAEGRVTAGKMGYVNMVGSSLNVINNDSWYYQSIAKFNEASPEIILPTLQSMLDKASRHYSEDGTKVRIQEVGKKGEICMQEAFPYTTCDFSKGLEVEYNIEDAIDYREDMINITAFVINRDTVVSDTISVTYDNQGFYKISLEIDLSTEESRDLATDKPRQMLRDMANMNDLEFTIVELEVEIWDNGLPKLIRSHEEWSGSFNIFFTNLTISSYTYMTHYYSYHPNDSDYDKLNITIDF